MSRQDYQKYDGNDEKVAAAVTIASTVACITTGAALSAASVPALFAIGAGIAAGMVASYASSKVKEWLIGW